MNSPIHPAAPREAPETLFDAINQDRPDEAQRMIEADPGLIHAVRIAGRTPLHQAAFLGHAALVKWLVSQGAHVNAKTQHGWTPLFYAIAPLDESIGLLLLEHGADPCVRNDTQDTPLHFAASYGKTKIAEKLIEQGADVNARNAQGETPLDEAQSTGWKPMIRFLKKHGGKSGQPS